MESAIIERKCLKCGEFFPAYRSKVKMGHALYCSQTCYHASRNINLYQKNRYGNRIARRIMKAKPGEIVHHKDGDCRNNDPPNLMVFESQGEHLKYHSNLRKKELTG